MSIWKWTVKGISTKPIPKTRDASAVLPVFSCAFLCFVWHVAFATKASLEKGQQKSKEMMAEERHLPNVLVGG